MKNNKGFTLIELMIAIAIIGILALVLIPKVAGLKDSAREQGLDTNVRMGVSVAENMVDNYTASEDGCADLETALIAKLNTQGIANPFTKNATAISAAPAAGAAAFAALGVTGTDEEIDDDTATILATADPNYSGVIYVDAYVKDGTLKVNFTPCDKIGTALIAKAKSTN